MLAIQMSHVTKVTITQSSLIIGVHIIIGTSF